MELNNSSDFKYFIQDMNRFYLGANYTYEEMIMSEDIPHKLKEAISRIFLKDTDSSTTIAGHLAKLQGAQISFLAYHQLKIKIKVTALQKSAKGYESSYHTFDEFIETYQEKVQRGEYFIEEITIKKLHLLAFSL